MRSPEYSAKIIADSTHAGKRLTTFQLCYWRAIHGEVMTHRVFCISGDARLDFDLPSPSSKGGRRVYSMSLREFADKWFNGATEGKTRWPGVTRRFSLRSRLREMQIRQLDGITGDVSTSHVLDCTISGNQPVFRITAGDFSTVATSSHRFLTFEGWKPLGEIIPKVDRLCTYRYGDGANPDPFKKINGRWVSTWANQVRKEVADRQDNKCHLTGEPLQPSFDIHHLEPKHKRPDLAFELSNVVAVNPDAHKKSHETQGWQVGVPLGSKFVTVDSIESEGIVDTYDLEIEGAANFFADGIVVHNSRNAMSSRAIPVAKMIEQVLRYPAEPIFWGSNKPGMQAGEELEPSLKAEAIGEWSKAAVAAAKSAKVLSDLGAHKQVANRLLEPFQWMNTVVTATEWDNFWELRCHKDAMPEFQHLARMMREVYETTKPTPLEIGQWHLPYVQKSEYHLPVSTLVKLSTARCARVSYNNHDSTAPIIDRDIQLHDALVAGDPIHASPAEHQGTPYPLPDCWDRIWAEGGISALEYVDITGRWGNFKGWGQYRKYVEQHIPI